ncbi:DUF3276 family protein [Marinifilum flexuosum]|uniref:Uncharacterized protein DUF3276 n=1 Tax=Marinifilum flexuosum TaxID=1117708 RepID=A0A419X3V7_9BACT|nr:DUF3276 family protein [Marinifilum flexuosum]RKE02289.1 uncharacterized protein DUF3276 [Marinifilum flexuosum]
MEGYDNKDGYGKKNRDEIFSNAVRAGKRTYFFDVKATRKNDYYLTITESKKRYDKEGNYSFEKHKVFLYKEDFDKFSEGLLEALDFIKSSNQETNEVEEMFVTEEQNTNSELIEGLEAETYSNVEFEDLSE